MDLLDDRFRDIYRIIENTGANPYSSLRKLVPPMNEMVIFITRTFRELAKDPYTHTRFQQAQALPDLTNAVIDLFNRKQKFYMQWTRRDELISIGVPEALLDADSIAEFETVLNRVVSDRTPSFPIKWTTVTREMYNNYNIFQAKSLPELENELIGICQYVDSCKIENDRINDEFKQRVRTYNDNIVQGNAELKLLQAANKELRDELSEKENEVTNAESLLLRKQKQFVEDYGTLVEENKAIVARLDALVVAHHTREGELTHQLQEKHEAYNSAVFENEKREKALVSECKSHIEQMEANFRMQLDECKSLITPPQPQEDCEELKNELTNLRVGTQALEKNLAYQMTLTEELRGLLLKRKKLESNDPSEGPYDKQVKMNTRRIVGMLLTNNERYDKLYIHLLARALFMTDIKSYFERNTVDGEQLKSEIKLRLKQVKKPVLRYSSALFSPAIIPTDELRNIDLDSWNNLLVMNIASTLKLDTTMELLILYDNIGIIDNAISGLASHV